MTAAFETMPAPSLAARADALIPAGDGIAASEAVFASSTSTRSWRRAGLRPALASVSRDRRADPAARGRIETTDPGGLGTLTTVVGGAYFLNPESRKAATRPPAIPSTTARSPWLLTPLDSVKSARHDYRPRRGPEAPAPRVAA